MITLLFGILSIAFGLITLYFCYRYYLRRRLPSLVCAVMPAGWVVAFGLPANRIPGAWLPVLFGLGIFVAGMSIYIIVSHELSRATPFR